MTGTMTTNDEQAVSEPDSQDREYQLAGFFVGIIVALLVIVPLGMLML